MGTRKAEEIIAAFAPAEPRLSPGWIAPDGTFWPCEYWQHDLVAEQVYPEDGTLRFERERWVRLHDNGTFKVGGDSGLVEPRVTQAQLDTLFDICVSPQEGNKHKTEMAEVVTLWLQNILVV